VVGGGGSIPQASAGEQEQAQATEPCWPAKNQPDRIAEFLVEMSDVGGIGREIVDSPVGLPGVLLAVCCCEREIGVLPVLLASNLMVTSVHHVSIPGHPLVGVPPRSGVMGGDNGPDEAGALKGALGPLVQDCQG
jgi:hypothetical protein